MKQLTIGELIEKLEPLLEKQPEVIKKYNSEASIIFDFAGLYPTGFSSWRGDYSELAINFAGQEYGDQTPGMTLTKFVDALKQTIGKTYQGWKGGDFTMDEDTRLWVDNSGNCNSTGVYDIEDGEYEVILRTNRFKY